MTNWCKNFLRVTGPAQDVSRFQQQAVAGAAAIGDTPEVFSFQSLVPLPEQYRTSSAVDSDFGGPRQEWGCRCDARQSERVETWDEGVVYRFATAWNPPLPFLRQVSQSWPTLVFVLDYEEPMLAYRGLARAAAGSVQHFQIAL